MKAVELKKWMEKNDVTEVDIASALKIHPITIYRFLKGKSVNRSTLAGFERFISSFSEKQPGGLKTTGT